MVIKSCQICSWHAWRNAIFLRQMHLFANDMADPDISDWIWPIIDADHQSSLTTDAVKFSNTISYLHSNAILNLKMYSCIFLGLKITKIKIPRNIVERLWHINNVTSYEDLLPCYLVVEIYYRLSLYDPSSSLNCKDPTLSGFVYTSILIKFN